jgi:DNA-binding Lrp family transcriptional regulator
MVEAIIFVVAEPNKLDRVGMEIKKLINAKEVLVITGEFDIAVRVETKDFTELSKTIREQILSIPGVVKTVTSVVIGKY